MNSVVLIVLDGFGTAPSGPGNAIKLANPSNINYLLQKFPNTQLSASGDAVGLPSSEVGNTEVGHINMGAGRIDQQDLPRINIAIQTDRFIKTNHYLKHQRMLKNRWKSASYWALGERVVHSSIEHLYALLFFAKQQELTNVFVHAITDGRDSPPKSAIESIKPLEEKMKQLRVGKIATVLGRYYAMDRDRRWERVEKAYACLTIGSNQIADTAVKAVQAAYDNNLTDEFIAPTNIVTPGHGPTLIKTGDAVVYFNYRIDRPRELTKAFVLTTFKKKRIYHLP